MSKKCLYVTYFLRTQKGGIQAYLRYLGKGLRQYGWETETIFLDDVVPSSVLLGRSWLSHLFHSFSFLQWLLDGQRILVTENLLARLTKKVKESILKQKPDIIHVQDPYAGYAVLSLIRKEKIPLVVTNHGPVMRESEFGPRYSTFVDFMERETYQSATTIILVGEHLKSSVLPKAPATPYFVLHNAIDVDEFLAKGQKEYPNLPQNYILIVARLDPEKGVDIGLKAFQKIVRQYPGLRLVIVGNGRLRKELKKLAYKLGIIKEVHFLGWVPPEDISSIYRKAKIIWITSKPVGNIREPLPIVALESLAWGGPIVAAETGGLAEIFRKGGGLLVPPNNPEALFKETLKIFENPLLAKKLKCEAREIAKRDYDITSWVEKILSIYKCILK